MPLSHDSTKIQLKTKLSNSETALSDITLDRGEPLLDAKTGLLHIGDDKGTKVSYLPSGTENYVITATSAEYKVQAKKPNIKIVMEPGTDSCFEVTEDILPDTSNEINVGSSTLKFKEVYANEFIGNAVSYRNNATDKTTEGTIAKEFVTVRSELAAAIDALDSSITELKDEKYLTGITITNGKITDSKSATQTAVSVDTLTAGTSKLTHGGTFTALTAAAKGDTSHNIDVTPTTFTMPSETTLSVTDSQSGNAVTDVEVSGHAITLKRGKTFLTAHPTISKETDSTSTATPAHSGTFTAVDTITRDSNGHVTKINTKTVTIPAQYTHPTGNGNNHIPKDGQSGQILRWDSAGTAKWGADEDTKYTAGTNLTLSGSNAFNLNNEINLSKVEVATLGIKNSSGTTKAELVYDNTLQAVKFVFK